MGERPTTALWGIGAKTARRLAGLGIETVAAARRRRRPAPGRRSSGPTIGPWLRRLGRGVDSSPVDATPWVPRAHGRETTFQVDLTDWEEVAGEARRLAATVADDLRREGRPAARVGVKVRYVPFETRQRSLTLPERRPPRPTTSRRQPSRCWSGSTTTRAVRLLGVRAEMAPPGGDRSISPSSAAGRCSWPA